MSEDRKLTGKVAIVLGGSRGIGAAAARPVAREGANVGLTYVSAPDKAAGTVRAIEEEGRTGFAIKAGGASLRRWPHQHGRQQHRSSERLSWVQRLREDQGRGGRHGQGNHG